MAPCCGSRRRSNEYLEETRPDPPMMPADAAGRARVRSLMRRFDDLSDAYYAARRGEDGALEAVYAELAWLEGLLADRSHLAGDRYTLAEPGYWPWIVRLQRVGGRPGVLPGRLARGASGWRRGPEYAAELSLLLG